MSPVFGLLGQGVVTCDRVENFLPGRLGVFPALDVHPLAFFKILVVVEEMPDLHAKQFIDVFQFFHITVQPGDVFGWHGQDLGVFARFGYMPTDRNVWNIFVSGGLGGRGLIPGRPLDRMGAGFYDYPEGAKKHLWPGLAEEYPPKDEQPAVAAIQQRLLYIQALETARCMEEGVVTDPADADVGSVFGWGFPPWTGGTLSYVDTVGLKTFLSDCEGLAETCGPRFSPPDWLKGKTSVR